MRFLGFLSTAALEIRADGTYAPFSSDAWGYAGQMTLLGMVMVFAVLAILWGVLAIFKIVFAGKTPKEAKPKPAPKAEVKRAETPAAAVSAAESNDAELVAIITAAVAAYRESEGEPTYDGSFRVVSFKRTANRAWNSK